MKLYKFKNEKGQSFVEVIVACGLLAVVMVAIMSVVAATKNMLYTSESQTKATTLAQEGIEIVRHQRDIGCGFNLEQGYTKVLISNTWFIKGDDGISNDETLVTAEPSWNIGSGNFRNFTRKIYIYRLDKPTSDGHGGYYFDIDGTNFGFDYSGFPHSDPSWYSDYDGQNKYYFIAVKVTDTRGTPATNDDITSMVPSIIRKVPSIIMEY